MMDGPVALPGVAGPDFAAFVRRERDGSAALSAMVEGVHCGGCVARIERALKAHPAVVEARVNLTTRRLALAWQGPAALAPDLAGRVQALGFALTPYDPLRLAGLQSDAEKTLLRALAVAGFGMANIMLLSVGIWAGHFEGMDAATRELLHWFSALIGLPILAYAIRPFLRSAVAALRGRRLNMDVPIVVGVALTAAMSLFETIRGGEHAYFDSAVSLVFFLLLGRYLDLRARGRARAAAERLLALAARAVTVILPDGSSRALPADRVEPGMVVAVAAGERIGVDGRVAAGRSDIDMSVITGETVPVAAAPGARVFAGALNVSAPLRIEAAAAGENTLLAEIVRLMEAAEQRKSAYVALADRVSRLYAPVVHLLALATFLLWWGALGAAWQAALLNAIAVLIITCPCALGLAVPAVQVIATGRLLKRGILLKSGTALERLATVDTVVFDKTGTLTLGRPDAIVDPVIADADLTLAASMAASSLHPLSRALRAARPDAPAALSVREHPGQGLSLAAPEGEIRLGSRAWCGVAEAPGESGLELWLAQPKRAPVRFAFADRLRGDARDVVSALRRRGLRVLLLSGDREATVAEAAAAAGIDDFAAACSPAEKVRRLEELRAAGRTVLMVGDGLNDAPALAAAAVSLSPATAADISQTAADAVFQGEALAPVLVALETARRARALVRQNIAAAILYNLVAVPIAVAGLLTPLLAAAAMSTSSVGVVLNALRLARGGHSCR